MLVSKQIDDISEILEADLHKESGQIAQSMHWKDAQLENGMQSLVLAGNKLLEGKADMVDFISELSLTLEGIMLLKPFKIPNQGTECDSKLAEHAASAKMNLDGLSCIALPPNKELEAGETLLEEEFPTTLNQSVGANAEVGNLRTEKSDNDDHLKAQEETSLSDQDRLQVITLKLLLNLACTVHNRPPKLAPNSTNTMLTFSAEIIRNLMQF